MDTMKLGTQTGSLINHLTSSARDAAPAVGMGATILGWTDRYACTIVEVSASRKRVTVQRDNARRTDTNGMSDCQSYEYSPNVDAPREVFTLRKSGAYVRQGDSMSGNRLKIGARNHYHDFSF